MIAIDLDGTLLNDQKQIPKENIVAIQKATEAGLKIVLCTGRPSSGTKPYFDQLGLTKEEFLILNNGCSTYNSPNWELRHAKTLDLSDVASLEALSQPFPDVYLTLTGEKDYLVLEETVPELVQADGDLVFTRVKATDLRQLEQSGQVIFQAMYMGEKEALDRFELLARDQLAQSYSVVRSQETILEIMPKGVTKAYALKALANDLSISPQEVMAIGDAPNDIEMLQYAGLGVAMGNAEETIKVLADKVSLTNNQAGVAHAIYQFAMTQST